MTFPTSRGSRVLDAAGGFLFAAGLLATAGYFQHRVSTYDEAGLLTNAFLLEDGALHYRDFYSSYPPGISLLILSSWKLLGVSVTAPRVLGFLLHVAVALGAARLAGRASDRAFSWFTAGIVTVWLSALGVVPFAWLAAMAAALWALVALTSWWERRTRGTALTAGALLGLVPVFRHDLFAYLALALLGLAVLRLMQGGRSAFAGSSLSWLIAGLAVMALPFWLFFFAKAGFGVVVRDLYFDQVHHVAPRRKLPFEWSGLVPTSLRLVTVAVGVASPILTAGIAVAALRNQRQVVAGVLLFALSLSVMPQMFGRSEWAHVLQTVTPGLIAIGILLERMMQSASRPATFLAATAAALILLMGRPFLPRGQQWLSVPRLDFSRPSSGMPATQYESARPAVEFVQRYSKAGEPIFVGNSQHRLVTYNDLSIYYLAQRPGSTRHMQFDPGLTTSEGVQREMIRELELARPKVMILLKGGWVREPNPSNEAGAAQLDDYISQHYRVADTSEHHIMLLRR